jgi:hypothetical protein
VDANDPTNVVVLILLLRSRQKITSISHPPPRRALFREEEARKNKETVNSNILKGPALRNSKGGIYSSPHISSCYYNNI